MTVTQDMKPRRLSGRCLNGSERDGGRRWHAVADSRRPWGRALCGAKPGPRSGVGWTDDVGKEITCPRCLAALARARLTWREGEVTFHS